MIKHFFPLLATLILIACSDDNPTQDTSNAGESQKGKTAQTSNDIQPAKVAQPVDVPAPAVVGGNQGRIISTEQAGSYTYIEVDTSNGRKWLAATRIQLKNGDTIRWKDSATMKNFHSKQLNRTFPEVLFVAAVSVLGSGGAQPAAVPAQPMVTRAKVVNVIESGQYNYIEVAAPGGTRWLAAPAGPVSTNDQIEWTGGSVMPQFTSKSLNRTFENILFVQKIKVMK